MTLRKAVLLVFVLVGCAQTTQFTFQRDDSFQYIGDIHTHSAVGLPNLGEMLTITQRYIFEAQYDQAPSKPIPIAMLTTSQLEALPDSALSVVRIGHSTVLLKINGEFWLTDPVFSETLGPVYFMGVNRLHAIPISINDLPEITGVLISHNHYDHLDAKTIQAIHPKVKHFVVPLGNGQNLADWGVEPHKITELDWWESKKIGDLTLTATPANHISGRILFDQNQALWSSWVVKHKSTRVFFSGDGGYSDIFSEIGERYGPFDLTIIENGAYDESWSNEHMTPAETLKAHQDLKGKILMPVHNSTFDLAFHPWYEPLAKVSELASTHNINLITPIIGAPYTLKPKTTENKLVITNNLRWWDENNYQLSRKK
jgi:L-ascorbate metabolism protein UlaG (beta-lactamase superfamily)